MQSVCVLLSFCEEGGGGYILVLLFYHVSFCLVPVTESLQFVVAFLLQPV